MVQVLGAGAETCAWGWPRTPQFPILMPRVVSGRRTRGAAGEEETEGRDRGLALLWSLFARHSGAEVCSAQTVPPSLFLPLLLVVVFPQDLLEKGLEADNFAMLGLGDIVIPGKDRRAGT